VSIRELWNRALGFEFGGFSYSEFDCRDSHNFFPNLNRLCSGSLRTAMGLRSELHQCGCNGYRCLCWLLFCVYLGVLVMILPWWTRIWDRNEFILARPWLAAILYNGAVRGMISGLGLLDIWIGISEAVHYRDYRG